MQITVNLMELLLALLILVGVALGVFLVVFVFRLIQTLKKVAQLSDAIQEPLSQTVGQLPAIMQRIDKISSDIETLTKVSNESVPSILNDTKAITATARAGVEMIGMTAENISTGFSSIIGPEREKPDNISSIIGIVSQILEIVGLFTHRDKAKQTAPFHRSSRRRRH